MEELLVGDYVEWAWNRWGTIVAQDGEWVLIQPDDPWLYSRWIMARECKKL